MCFVIDFVNQSSKRGFFYLKLFKFSPNVLIFIKGDLVCLNNWYMIGNILFCNYIFVYISENSVTHNSEKMKTVLVPEKQIHSPVDWMLITLNSCVWSGSVLITGNRNFRVKSWRPKSAFPSLSCACQMGNTWLSFIGLSPNIPR